MLDLLISLSLQMSAMDSEMFNEQYEQNSAEDDKDASESLPPNYDMLFSADKVSWIVMFLSLVEIVKRNNLSCFFVYEIQLCNCALKKIQRVFQALSVSRLSSFLETLQCQITNRMMTISIKLLNLSRASCMSITSLISFIQFFWCTSSSLLKFTRLLA